jgi:hypothetical protein
VQQALYRPVLALLAVESQIAELRRTAPEGLDQRGLGRVDDPRLVAELV